MTNSPQDGAQDGKPERAAIFVDFENLYRTLSRTVEYGDKPAELISEMIEALQRSLLEDRKAQTAVTRAYADFASLPGGGDHMQQSLYLRGAEPHFVPRARNENVVELQLCVDAMDVLHHRTDITTFVLLTGRRIYLPLIRMFRRYGRQVLVAGLDEPAAVDDVRAVEGNWFFPAHDLLSTSARRHVDDSDSTRKPPSSDRSGEIDDPFLFQTVEIIVEYFGQYEEVYLTPLLRKLSELLDERRHDPKNLISDLEECGAARLEKRTGFPHDYTVLILEEHHPTVARVQSVMRSSTHYSSTHYEDPRVGRDDTAQIDGDESYRYNGNGDYDDDHEQFDSASSDGQAFDGETRDEAFADELAQENRIDDANPSRSGGWRAVHRLLDPTYLE